MVNWVRLGEARLTFSTTIRGIFPSSMERLGKQNLNGPCSEPPFEEVAVRSCGERVTVSVEVATNDPDGGLVT